MPSCCMVCHGDRTGADPEKNLTGFQLPANNHYEYIYGNFRVLNIREFQILGL